MMCVPIATPDVREPAAPRIIVAGDWHGDTRWAARVLDAAADGGHDTVVQLGDFGFWPGAEGAAYLATLSEIAGERGLQLIVIDGNHDDHHQLRRWAADAAHRTPSGFVRTAPNVWWATRGLRWSWHGRRLGALGGAFSIDHRFRTPGQSWWPEEEVIDADVERLGDAPIDILFTHEAPSASPVVSMFSLRAADHARASEGRARIDEAVEATRPSLVLHGHWHQRVTGLLTGGAGGRPGIVEGLAENGSAGNVVEVDLIAATVSIAVRGRNGAS